MCLSYLYFTQRFGVSNFTTRRFASVGLFSEIIILGVVKCSSK